MPNWIMSAEKTLSNQYAGKIAKSVKRSRSTLRRSEAIEVQDKILDGSLYLTRQDVREAANVVSKGNMRPDAYEKALRDEIQTRRIKQIQEGRDPRVENKFNRQDVPEPQIEPPKIEAPISRSPELFMNERVAKRAEGQYEILNSGDAKRINGLRAELGLGEGIEVNADHIEDFRRRALENGPNLVDKMKYHRVPQVAGGVAVTGFLVTSMAGRKGELSNSELYGQQTPYQ